jgi:hypothetical protein
MRSSREIELNRMSALVKIGYSNIVDLKTYLIEIATNNNVLSLFKNKIDNENDNEKLKIIGIDIIAKIKRIDEFSEGGRHREMNLKDIKELCKANQIKLSRVVDGKRVAYKKKELMTKLKRKKLL